MNVALALGSGGARGLAHIGAIEELEQRDYHITSIAGTSMGAMIAGMYAAGRLGEAKEWFLGVTKRKMLALADFKLTTSSIVEGERVIEALKQVVPDVEMADLSIPTAMVAADIISGREVVFRSGPMFDAIRASISLPLFFRPVEHEGGLLIDGGILNPLPLDRLERTPNDLLVASDISAPAAMTTRPGLDSIVNIGDLPVARRLGDLADKVKQIEQRIRRTQQPEEIEPSADLTKSVNYLTLTDRISDMQIEQNTLLRLSLNRPDIHASMSQYAFPTTDYDRAAEIIEAGRRMMRLALDEYESRI